MNIRTLHSLFLLLMSVALTALAGGCSKDEPSDPTKGQEDEISSSERMSLLIYAIASNSLQYDFHADTTEIVKALPEIDLEKGDIYVYSVTPGSTPNLMKLVKKTETGKHWEMVKEYDRQTFSTDPKRISQVISDFKEIANADTRGIIFWSHGASWNPAFSDHIVDNSPKSAAVVIDGQFKPIENKWFGQDKYGSQSDYCDLIELTEAIPENTFDFIWFDCCYMSAIEVLYQMRDKAPYIVGCPTEVAAAGMPYDLTMPFIVKKDFDLVGAASAMADYYLSNKSVITIAVMDMAAIEDVATEAEKAVTGDRISPVFLQKYSRNTHGPYYDFGQYTRTWGESLGDQWNTADFNAAMDKFVIYKAASDRGFDGRPIKPENFSGISVHYFNDYPEDEAAAYYKSLDWFKRVYTTVPSFQH